VAIKFKTNAKKRLKTESKRVSKAKNYTEDKRFRDQLDLPKMGQMILRRWWNFTGFS
jgi:hypothetical protein